MELRHKVYSSKYGLYTIFSKHKIFLIGLILSLFLIAGFSLKSVFAAGVTDIPEITNPSAPVTVNTASYNITGTVHDASDTTVRIYKDVNNNGVVDSPDDTVVGFTTDTTNKVFSVSVSLDPGANNFVATAEKHNKDESGAADVPTITYSTVTIDTDNIHFVNSPKYVRENNSNDIDAQIVTYEDTTEVEFYVDGNTGSPVPGYDIGTSSTGYHWWRLKTPLAAGEHTITGKVKIYGDWYDISDSGTVYSLDLPWAEYIIPSSINHFFRPNDKVVRVKADDEFNQFKKMNTEIDGTTYTVERADCNDQGSYVLCDLQNLGLAEGTYQADTTTYTMANNRYDHLISNEFTIDGTKPEISNFHITDVHSVYGDSVSVAADATDANGIDNVNFYVTAPRVGDNVCDGNGTHLSSMLGTNTSGDTYETDLDTSSLNGDYCLNVIAEDVAANHSAILKIKASFDNIPPANPTLVSPLDNSVVNGASITQSWSDTSSDVDHYIYESYNDASATSLRWHQEYSTTSKTATNVTETTYWWRLKAVDHAGNTSGWSPLWKITVDNTVPDKVDGMDIKVNGNYIGCGAAIKQRAITVDWNDSTDPYFDYYEYQADEDKTSPYDFTTTLIPSERSGNIRDEDGTYNYRVRAYDAAGNVGEWSEWCSVTLDRVAPDTIIAAPGAGDYTTGPQSVTLTSGDSGSGLENIYYTTDGSDPDNGSTPYTSPIDITVDTTLKAIAYDNAGNTSPVLIAEYGIAPIISGEGSTSTTTSSVVIEWDTDQPATSRVVYDTSSHSLGSPPNYGYAFSTVEDSTKVTHHVVIVTGLTDGTTYYFRTVSHGSPESTSGEIVATTDKASSAQTTSNNNSSNNNSTNSFSTTSFNTFGTFGTTNPTGGGNVLSTNDDNNGNNNDNTTDGEVKADAAGTSSATTEEAGKSGWSWWWILPILAILLLLFALWRRRDEEEEAQNS